MARRARRGGEAGGSKGPTSTRRVVLTLLARAYCHLCDDMREALAPLAHAANARVVELDVDADPALEAKYGELVPVLLLGDARDGVALCHYTLDVARVRAALER